MNAYIKRLFTVVLAVLLLPTTAAMSQVYIEPGTFGSSLWQGEVANAAALSTCNADTASTIHWIVDTGRLAHCPSDGSDWVYYTFGGGGGGGDLGDLDNVDETGAATGEALVSDGAGAWLPSTAAAILEGDSRLTNTRTPTAHATSHEDGGSDETAIEDLPTACTIGQVVESDGAGGLVCATAGGGAVSIADLTSGTNTTMAGVIGAGASLKIASTGTIDASAIDADGDGNRNVYTATVGGAASVCLSPADAGACQGWFADYVGGSWYTPYVFTTGIFLGGSLAVAESQWWFRPLSGSRLLIQSNSTTATLEIGNDGNPYVDLTGVRNYGALASPPTCSADGQSYIDTDDGGGNAADCVCLDSGWVKRGGAGTCGT